MHHLLWPGCGASIVGLLALSIHYQLSTHSSHMVLHSACKCDHSCRLQLPFEMLFIIFSLRSPSAIGPLAELTCYYEMCTLAAGQDRILRTCHPCWHKLRTRARLPNFCSDPSGTLVSIGEVLQCRYIYLHAALHVFFPVKYG